MNTSKRARKNQPSFQQRYARWNQNPRVQLTAAIASFCAGAIWVVTGVVGPRSVNGGGAVLAGLFFLLWGTLCLVIALRTLRQVRPRGKEKKKARR